MHGTITPAPDIDDLARQITTEWRSAVASIINAGRLLIEAKEKVGHGNWGKLIEKLPFGDRTAQYLMAIAEHPVISNPKHVSNLPPSWGTLHRLTLVPERELEQFLSDGVIHCETQRKDANKLVDLTREV